jgi:hypothetical protein
MDVAMPEIGWDWLRKAGFIRDDERVQRVVLDFRLRHAVTVYKQCLADEEWFSVPFPPEERLQVVTIGTGDLPPTPKE